VRARDEHGQALSREELRDQLLMLLIAGHETTSNSLCWALAQLAQRPDVFAQIRREHAASFGSHASTSPEGFDPSRVRELHYLGAVIQETMRLMPIAVGVARKLWERPNEFDPTRFLHKKISMTAHFPFGLGVWR
jgi:cytochrome P450